MYNSNEHFVYQLCNTHTETEPKTFIINIAYTLWAE